MFSKSPDYKYVPYDIRKGGTTSRLATTILGAPPPLILGFHPIKRHAALITCDQGIIVLTFTLVLLVLKRFLMASSTSYLDVRSMVFSRFIMLYCLPSTNIMLFLYSHVSILC